MEWRTPTILPSDADGVALDPRLRNQVLKRRVNVARPGRDLPFRVRQLVYGAAFAKSAHIERKRVGSSRR